MQLPTVDRRILSGLLVVLIALPVGADAQSPSPSMMPSEQAAGA